MLVLGGGQQTLARYSPVVILELSDKLLQSIGTGTAKVKDFLYSLGYLSSHRTDENMVFAKSVLRASHPLFGELATGRKQVDSIPSFRDCPGYRCLSKDHNSGAATRRSSPSLGL